MQCVWQLTSKPFVEILITRELTELKLKLKPKLNLEQNTTVMIFSKH